jgi:8-oxo-dGTP pyrophosphatase MutT (NUDIX family)
MARSTGRFLVALRSARVFEPGTWGTIGGKVEPWESPEDAAVREFREETRSRAKVELTQLFVYRDGGFSYRNYLGVIPREFTPRKNWETDRWAWLTLEELLALEPKHFGLAALLDDEESLHALAAAGRPVGVRQNPRGPVRYLYHVTYLFNLAGIARGGLAPGSGQTFRGTPYEGYSRGWLFLTEAAGVKFWASRLEDHANANTDHPEEGWAPVVISIAIPAHLVRELDEVGTRDAVAQAWRTRETIPVKALTCWDGEEWSSVKGVDEAVVEDMREAWTSAGEERFEDDGTSWWDLDFDFFLPPDEELADESEG